MPNPVVAVIIRVGTPGSLAFQLRKVETGLSVFDPAVMDPPLTEEEILDAFRPGAAMAHTAFKAALKELEE